MSRWRRLQRVVRSVTTLLLIPLCAAGILVAAPGTACACDCGTPTALATLSSIDPQLHEAAVVDGASRIKRMWHIDLPGIMPVAVILLILNIGSILSIGFEKVLLMQNSLNLSASEVIDTYVYKVGLAAPLPQFSYAAAIGLFRSVVGLILLVLANQIARKFAKSSLW